MVSSAIYEGRGTVQTLRVLFKSLGGRMGSYGGLQYHARDYIDTQESGCCSMVTEWF